MSRVPELGRRGEGWVVLQFVLFGATAACGFTGVYWPHGAESFFAVLGLVPTALLVALFDLKARREEEWLAERYPEYAAYRECTWRLVPWLY